MCAAAIRVIPVWTIDIGICALFGLVRFYEQIGCLLLSLQLSRSTACSVFRIIVAVGNLFYFVWYSRLFGSLLCARDFFFHFRCSLFEFVCVWCFLILCMRFFSLSTSRSSFTVVLNGATHATKHAISIIFPINEKLKGRSCSRLQKM